MDKERTWACMMLMYRGFGSIFCYKYSKKIKGTTSLLKFYMASGSNKSPRFFVLSMSIFDKVVGIHTGRAEVGRPEWPVPPHILGFFSVKMLKFYKILQNFIFRINSCLPI